MIEVTVVKEVTVVTVVTRVTVVIEVRVVRVVSVVTVMHKRLFFVSCSVSVVIIQSSTQCQ